MFLTNVPQKCTDWSNVANLSSEHKGFFVTMKISDMIVKEQFAVFRDTRRLNAANMLPLLRKFNNFKDKLTMLDPNKITDGLMTKLNKVIC